MNTKQNTFERFTLAGKTYKPFVSIRKNDTIALSQGTMHRFKLHEYSHIVLFYSEKQKKIGIKATNDEAEEGAIRPYKREQKIGGKTYKSIIFSAKSFLDYYDLKHSKSTSYLAYWDDEHQMITVDLVCKIKESP